MNAGAFLGPDDRSGNGPDADWIDPTGTGGSIGRHQRQAREIEDPGDQGYILLGQPEVQGPRKGLKSELVQALGFDPVQLGEKGRSPGSAEDGSG
jgi:hypothetical protein